MNKILIILSVFFVACSNNTSREKATDEHKHDGHNTPATKAASELQLNNGAKWKSDETTRGNVAELVKIMNDSSSVDIKNKTQFANRFQAGTDILVKQCKMKGPDHDALHVWLEQVLRDMKELKEKDEHEYAASYAVLKKHVESFYDFFE